MKRKRIRLDAEIEALLAAAGNIDPCMFTEDTGGKEGERLYDAWESGHTTNSIASRPWSPSVRPTALASWPNIDMPSRVRPVR